MDTQQATYFDQVTTRVFGQPLTEVEVSSRLMAAGATAFTTHQVEECIYAVDAAMQAARHESSGWKYRDHAATATTAAINLFHPVHDKPHVQEIGRHLVDDLITAHLWDGCGQSDVRGYIYDHEACIAPNYSR